MIINENIESSHNKEEKNSLFTTYNRRAPCVTRSVDLINTSTMNFFVLLVHFGGTVIVVLGDLQFNYVQL